METIKGYVSSIRYRNPSNGYSVMGFVVDENEETIVGLLPGVDEGQMLEVSGEWVVHPVYDRQFSVSSFEEVSPTDEISIIRYLSSGIIKGIGETLARRIYAEFGSETFKVMEEQPELLERIKGISLRKAQEIGVMMLEKRGFREAMVFLGQYGIGNALAIKIYSFYGDRVYNIIRENPYKLAEDIAGVGFRTADEISAMIGIKRNSVYRIHSGVQYTLSLAVGAGHMYLPRDILLQEASVLLDIPKEQIEPEISNLIMDRKLFVKGTEVYSPANYYAEQSIAGMLRNVSVDFFETGIVDEKSVALRMEMIARHEGMKLDSLQEKAVLNAASYGVSIITGGPGTGKTTTIKAILEYFELEDLDVALAAPTGRAAKRMTEATGYEAKTIHRLLELSGSPESDRNTASFERNDENPLEVDAVIVDEMSMVDVFIFRALLKALAPGTRLILVGDANQLPSVGPGQVLRDLIECAQFPVTSLETIYRQEGSGDIVINAHRINRGEELVSGNKSKDFFFIERNDAQKILLNTVELITKSLPPYVETDTFDIQVLTPMRKGPLGVISLNRFLQEKLNPHARDKAEHLYGDNLFREGDKVMQIRNNYQAQWEVLGKYNIAIDAGMGVFNGDTGRVISVDDDNSCVTVEFDDRRRVRYAFENLDELELAYAITIHKSQGSEYPAVVMPLLSGPRQLMNRNLLYTGVTRAKKCLVLVGSRGTVQEMIDNDHVTLRYSGLKDRIEEIFAE